MLHSHTSKNDAFTTRIDEVSDTLMYIGQAIAGSGTDEPNWRVFKLDTTSGLIITYADGNTNYDNIWDNRASLTFN